MPAKRVRWQKARLREVEFIRLHTSGLTYEEIGELYGITRQAVGKAILCGLRRVQYEAADEWRKSILSRLEGQYDLLIPAMEDGDVRAHEAGARILGEIARVTGAYAPTKQEVTGGAGEPLRIVIEYAGDSD